MTVKEKEEIIQIITECFDKHDQKMEQIQTRQSNVEKLQKLFDELVSFHEFVTNNPKYKIKDYTIIETLSHHALNMVELDKYIQEQSQEISECLTEAIE